ncbi:uncharacterized protein [Typha angustifolia]|uniref:uncharacterized protein n=1 Tax=Typha angustifolia TaxID=59011 RepID=UPI003C2C5EDE
MKLMYFLMERDDVHRRRLELEEEVAELQIVLAKEQKLNQIWKLALQGPFVWHSCLSSLVPLQVQVLLEELAMVEEEIICLERKLEDLKLCLYQERKQNKEWNFQQQQQQQWWQRQQRNFLCGLGGRKEVGDGEQLPELPNTGGGETIKEERKAYLGLVSNKTIPHTRINDEEADKLKRRNESDCSFSLVDKEISTDSPNKLSEELIRILISIFHKLRQVSDTNGTAKFIHFTRGSFDLTRISLCLPAIGRLRALMHKLCTIKLSLLTYKQRVAFWINIYNACIMHAFLQHGLPSSPDKMLALLNKAAANIGGIVLNALAIEHFILRSSSDTKHGIMDEREGLLRHAYGLGYPEPNVTFALCRGSRSSPALRVYTAEDVVDELEKAKVEYLEASVRITGKKKIIIPKHLHWHMRDFADDTESLLEWIYSQLPRSGSLKRVIKELLSGGSSKVPLSKMVEFENYDAEFHYLLPLEL